MQTKRYFLCFLTGAAGYGCLEILWRGYTHWTMLVCGGLCLMGLYRISVRLPQLSVLLQAALGAVLITAVEFCTGCIVNLGFHLNVWDYSSLRFNLLGQISLLFSAVWYLLCAAVFSLLRLSRAVRRRGRS